MRAHTIAFATGVILSISGFIPGAALAQNAVKPIGKVLSATGAVTIERVNAVVVQAALGTQPGQTKVGDPIYLGDIVATGPDGRAGIVFTDGSAFDLSSNARMAMTEFVYDPDSSSNSTLLSLTKGTFTFVAGKIAKSGDMKIDTPVATMGIRGTTPHVEILDDGTVKFSTLIEEGKEEVKEKYGAPKSNRHGGASPDILKEGKKPNLDICRGC
jgi:hypothetical protein